MSSKNVHVIVFSPREPKPREFEFPPSDTVGDAASKAGAAFGYPAGLNLTFAKGKTVLNRTETLAAEGVDNGDKLELVDTGGGV